MLRILVALLLFSGVAQAQPSAVINADSLADFDNLTADEIVAAASLRVAFVNQSVGSNIADGLKVCLSKPTSYGNGTTIEQKQFKNQCLKWQHVVAAYNSPPSEVSWSGSYDTSNITYFWMGTGGTTPYVPCTLDCAYWYGALNAFMNFVDAHASEYDVFLWMPSYLHVMPGTTFMNFFTAQVNRPDYQDFQALRQRHPDKVISIATTSLARGTTEAATPVNAELRNLTQDVLLDVASVESRDPYGVSCYDNRDGVFYSFGGGENYPDDGINTPAICQHYTSEKDGGHLGSASAGKIRMAKAFLLFLVEIAR